MFRKRVGLMVGLALIGVLLASLATARVLKERLTASSAQQETKAQGNNQEEPTPVQEGAMTEKQKKNSKLFKGYKDVTKGKKLRQLVTEQGDVTIGKMVPQRIRSTSFSLDKYLQTLACKADLVVVGTIKNKSSQIIEEGTFVFTDYEVTVEESLKNSSNTSARPNAALNVTRIGGAVKLNGHTVRAIDQEQRPLEVGGRYLLFLTYIAESDSYTSAFYGIGEDSFRLRGNSLTQVSSLPLPLGASVVTDADDFMAGVRRALASSCATGGAE